MLDLGIVLHDDSKLFLPQASQILWTVPTADGKNTLNLK